ncbi:hypothetical protein J4Q44_G00193790 [Coregonus suidteri]|uniref:Peptidase M14 domain-containing protein n=1 Tax=Coregonus suidteri TaxID=861788 RepID=A0AAN8QSL3_9TELE
MESQAVTEFLGSRTDDILCYLTIHSSGQLILLPYGHPQIQATHRYRPPTDTGHPQIQATHRYRPPTDTGHPQIQTTNYDELVKVGKAAAELTKSVHGMNYRMGTSPQVLYPNSGSSRDWAHLIGIPFSYTFELRDKGQFGHLLPEYQIQPSCEEAFVGALSIITYVHDKTFY